jgi:hypothetical protein
MTDLDRRSVALAALLAPLTAATAAGAAPPLKPTDGHDMTMAPADWTHHDQIAMLVYPKMTALDLIGPQYMFASLMGAKVHRR